MTVREFINAYGLSKYAKRYENFVDNWRNIMCSYIFDVDTYENGYQFLCNGSRYRVTTVLLWSHPFYCVEKEDHAAENGFRRATWDDKCPDIVTWIGTLLVDQARGY